METTTHDTAQHPGGRPRSWLIRGFLAGLVLAGGAIWAASTLLADAADPVAMPAPSLVEEASAAGINHSYDGEFAFFVGGGVAVFDCNGDGFSDLYFAGGANPASLYRNTSPVGGELRFSHMTASTTDLTDVVGAYPLDVDSDGHVDLAVLRRGENVMLKGVGECRFERANEPWGIDGGDAWTAAFSAIWESDDQLPTLAFGNYLSTDESGAPLGECADNTLLRPASSTLYGEGARLSPGWCTLSILFSDWNRSGQSDLRMANDRHYYREGEEQLWRVEPGEPARLYTGEDGWKSMQIWGMGIASYDITGDGRPEVVLTSQGDNKLQTLEDGASGPSYVDIAIRRGVTAHRPFAGDNLLPSTAWHPEFQDVNNDGFIDLYISKGNVDAMVEYAAEDPSNLLLGQPDGTFVEGAMDAGILSFRKTRGAALVDLNLDGLLDLVEVNRRENVTLWRNRGDGSGDGRKAMGNWLGVRLVQTAGNVDAIGAWVQVRTRTADNEREVTVGGGHGGGQLGWIHFGLGADDSAEIRVQWPDGEVGPWLPAAANSWVIIERGAGEARTWNPGTGAED